MLVRVKLLLWVAVAFALLAVRSAIVLVDGVQLFELDLAALRVLAGSAAVGVLIHGLRQESR